MNEKKLKFEIHLQYSFAPFAELIQCDKIIYGNGIITAVHGDSATQIFPSSDVIIKKIVQNFGWEQDMAAVMNGIKAANDLNKANGNTGVV